MGADGSDGPPEPEPDWWPNGADEALVRECNCPTCEALVGAIGDLRDGVAVDGKHRAIESYAGGAADD